MTFTMDAAIQLARRAHEGQLDLGGRPYIGHPLRVMGRVAGEYERMAAVLHDVVEDTEVTLAELAGLGCPAPVLAAIDAVTKRADEPAERYLARVAANPIAVTVKHADIADNLSPDRLSRLDEQTRDRLRAKYENALRLLAG